MQKLNPSSEDFQAWRTHPVSQWVMEILRASATSHEAEWRKVSWEGGKADPLLLLELKTRADAYLAIEETTYEGWCASAGVDPVFE